MIYIRAVVDPQIGMGHIMRYLSIAERRNPLKWKALLFSRMKGYNI